MVRDCPEPSKEEGMHSVQAGEDDQIQLNLSYKDTNSNVEGFDLFYLVVEETINEPDTIGAEIIGIERRILGDTEEHSFLNKGDYTQGSVKAVSTRWLILDSQSTVNFIMKNETVKYTVCPFPLQFSNKDHQDGGNPPQVQNRLF